MTATVISVILLFAGLFGMGIAVAWIIRKGNNNRLTRLFGVCQISIILWIISQLLILFSVNLQQKQLSYTVGNVGISFFAPFWLIFSAEYIEVKSRFRKFFGILSALSVSAILLIVTNPVHHLYYSVFDMDNIEYAPLFYLYQVIYYI
ncbi:MAG: two-component sensor histidine kinase, partial [Ruminococcus sp.]|nr:two-component sensor histidine kinase [Ruminococcus sp.]